MKQPAFRVSADTTALIRILMTAKPGDLISWERLSTELGRDASPEGPAYTAVCSARRIVERDERIAFETVPTVGLRRLANDEIVDSGDKFLIRARRTAKRGVQRLICVEFDALTNEHKTQHNAKVSMMSAICEFASQKSLRRIEQRIVADSATAALPAAKAAIAALGETVK